MPTTLAVIALAIAVIALVISVTAYVFVVRWSQLLTTTRKPQHGWWRARDLEKSADAQSPREPWHGGHHRPARKHKEAESF